MAASMDAHGGQGDRPVEEMSYTEASAELDEIVGFFEGREVDVDQLVGRLVRATSIIEELDRRLRRTRVQVEQLVPRLTAVLEEAPGAEAESAVVPDDGSEPPAPDFEDSSDDVPSASTPGFTAELTAGTEPTASRGHSHAGAGEDDDAPGLF